MSHVSWLITGPKGKGGGELNVHIFSAWLCFINLLNPTPVH